MALQTRCGALCKLYRRALSAKASSTDLWETDNAEDSPWDFIKKEKIQKVVIKEPEPAPQITGPSRHHTEATELSFIYRNRPPAELSNIFGSNVGHLSSDANILSSRNIEKFSDFVGLNPTLLQRLEEVGYGEPTKIQKQSLAAAMNGKHCVIKSLTGGGKTLAFLVPALNKIIATEPTGKPQVVIVAPTRELCTQIVAQIELLIGPDRVQSLIGGAEKVRAQGKRMRAIEKNKGTRSVLKKDTYRDIIVATPGRIVQSVAMNILKPDLLKYLILDEADQLLNETFYDKVRFILDYSNSQKQIFITTATIPKEVQEIIDRYMRFHEYIDTGSAQYSIPDTIKHHAVIYNKGSKHQCLKYVLKQHHECQTMVFQKYAKDCEDIGDDLRGLGYTVRHIYSAMPHANREKVLQQFRDGKFKILVTTDIMARGVDIPNCDLVIHNNPVLDVDKFVHRSGRTGRQGREGTSVLILPNPRGGKKLSKGMDNYKLFLQDLSELVTFEYTHFDKTFVKKMGVKPS